MEKEMNKTKRIGPGQAIAALIIIIFLGSSFYMLFLRLTTEKAESKVTAEELTAAREGMYSEASENESNVSTAIFEEDIVISMEAAVETQDGTQSESDGTEAQKESKAKSEKKNTSSEYIFPNSNKKRLTDADVSGLSKDKLEKARNEIFARHGRIFSREDLKKYFESKSWYKGTVSPEDFDKNMNSRLNDIELYNIEMIKKYE